MVGVLFVCLGNICRSPAGEGILKQLVESDQDIENIRIESCGLGDWHVGQLPNPKMRQAAMDRDITLSSRAQQFKQIFLDEFDFILAADHEVLNDLYRFAESTEHKSKIRLMTAFSTIYNNEEVPDPYYGNMGDFNLALDMLQDACEGLLQELKK